MDGGSDDEVVPSLGEFIARGDGAGLVRLFGKPEAAARVFKEASDVEIRRVGAILVAQVWLLPSILRSRVLFRISLPSICPE